MTQPRLLGGRYQVGDTLGYGGMAEVHHGRDVRLGREVAIKVLRADLARDPSFQARFRREAQAAAALNHPAIVAVYDTGDESPQGYGSNGHTPYIVMEYVDGRTLRDVLKSEGRLHPQRAMEMAADICSALDFSHRTGIVHRDIKPGNVMITRAGAIKVMDFGIARAVADNAATMTATQAVIGTAQYLSPEQARGESVDARSDVYSLGCLLYELVCGHPPFTGDSPVAVAYQHVREMAPPPSQINPDVPPVLDAIIMKALAKNPMNRYQSAAEMRNDLLRAMSGRPVQAEPIMSDDERTTVLGGPMTSTMSRAGLPSTYADDTDDERGNRRALAFVLLGLAVVAVFVVAALITTKLLNNKDNNNNQATPPVTKVGVPSVVGDDEQTARQKLTEAGLAVAQTNKTQVTTNEQDVGTVLGQTPAANTQVDKGATITLTIGVGPNLVDVPNVLLYSTYDAAAQAVTQAKLVPIRQLVNSPQEAGKVVGSQPAAGTQVPPGTQVFIKISNGKSRMPNVIGKTQSEAQIQLAQAGFKNVQIQTVPPTDGSDFPEGSVWKTDPAKDQLIGPDSQITLFIVPAKPSSPPSSSSSPPPGPGTGTSSPSSPPGGNGSIGGAGGIGDVLRRIVD
jgi:eukaryotic-like serine/threonine-protein kinase